MSNQDKPEAENKSIFMPDRQTNQDKPVTDLEKLIAEAKARFEALSPEEQEAELQAQRESWVRGEMAIGLDREEAETRRELSLVERVRAATGPDRELDAEIYNTLMVENRFTAIKVQNWDSDLGRRLGRWHDGWVVGRMMDDPYAEELPRYTASVDAITALIEAKLPEWRWGLHMDNHHPELWRGYLVKPSPLRPAPFPGLSVFPAIALCIAFLSAWESDSARSAKGTQS